MAEPVGRGLRAARRSGLTSPGTGDPRRPPGHPTPAPARTPDKPHNRQRQDARARDHLAKLLVQESSRKRATRIGRWIPAKPQ